MKRIIVLILFIVLINILKAQIVFGPQNIIDGFSVKRAKALFPADIDNDGLMDVISASYLDDKIAWYKNEGNQAYSPQKIITSNLNCVYWIDPADLDNDGNIDILAVALDSDALVWYKNDGNGNFEKRVIVDNFIEFMCKARAVDIDNDGDLDIISAADNEKIKMVWYENDGKGNFDNQHDILSTSLLSSPYSMLMNPADVDKDGDIDVIIGDNFLYDWIVWCENDGYGNFDSCYTIKESISVSAISMPDIDNDGDCDLVLTDRGDEKIFWYRNDGNGNFDNAVIIDNYIDISHVSAKDIDNDGDMDILSASYDNNKLLWYENTDGNGTFVKNIISSYQRASFIHSEDMDGDGDNDVLAASSGTSPNGNYSRISWYENTDGNGNFSFINNLATILLAEKFVFPVDVDGDNAVDVIAVNEGSFLNWYKNMGDGEFSYPKAIDHDLVYFSSVYAVDLDGDNDKDIIASSNIDNRIAWFENDGYGNFSAQKIITDSAKYTKSVISVDIDNDGDYDVVSSSNNDLKVVWYENDGSGNFSYQNIISQGVQGQSCVSASDIDGDGDNDVISSGISHLIWFENLDGSGTYSAEKYISSDSLSNSVYSIDLDGDGDNDIITGSRHHCNIAWYKNEGGGVFTKIPIYSYTSQIANSVFADDLDGDGDNDIVAAVDHGSKYFLWFENLDGLGSFSESQYIIHQLEDGSCARTADLDNDGDKDIVTTIFNNGKVVWNENMTVPVILQNPYNTVVNEHGTANFFINKKSATSLIWQVNEGKGFLNLVNDSIHSGVTEDTLKIQCVSINMNGRQYRCILYNGKDSVISEVATLSVLPSQIVVEEMDLCLGDSITWHGSSYNTTGVYYDSLVNINGGDSIHILDLTVNPLPLVFLGSDTSIYDTTYIILDAGLGFISYLWNDDSYEQTLLVDSTHGIGQHTYWVVVTDTNTCSNSDTIQVEIIETIGIKETGGLSYLKIYPNPSNGLITIEKENNQQKYNIRILNNLGRLILQKDFEDKQTQIDLTDQPAGIYTIQLVEENKIYQQKVILE